MRCLECQYDLSKLSVHRCPECGREFDSDDDRAVDDEVLPADAPFFLRAVVILLLISIAVIAASFVVSWYSRHG